MSSKLKSAKGHAKNARNKLSQMERAKRKGNDLSEQSVQYALQEVEATIHQIEEEL